MSDLPKYHLRAQQADALLAPVQRALAELEHRTGHYLDRLILADADAEKLRAAHAALADARQQMDRLWRESQQLPRS